MKYLFLSGWLDIIRLGEYLNLSQAMTYKTKDWNNRTGITHPKDRI